jgi:hypothetical protein
VGVGERDAFDLALEELHVQCAGSFLVLPRDGQHLVGHVEAVGLARGADALGGEEHVDAAAGAEIQDELAGREARERGGVAAAEGRAHGERGEPCGLFRGVEVRGDRVLAEVSPQHDGAQHEVLPHPRRASRPRRSGP